MREEITIVLLVAILTGIYVLVGCLAALILITKNIVRWLKH